MNIDDYRSGRISNGKDLAVPRGGAAMRRLAIGSFLVGLFVALALLGLRSLPGVGGPTTAEAAATTSGIHHANAITTG